MTTLTYEQVAAGAAALSEDEQWDLRAYLMHLERVNDPAYQQELSDIMRRMDEGDKVSLMPFIRANASPEALKLLDE